MLRLASHHLHRFHATVRVHSTLLKELSATMASEAQQPQADSSETLPAAVARIMGEAQDWRRIMSLDADTSLSVYLDMKSPHAYIAVRPTLELARDYRVKIDFRPYTLSYTGMGLSTTVENNERRPPSAESDRRARMFYTAARQYTALQRIPLRSPHRLLDVELAHRVFVFAKRQMLEVPFMMSVCLRGWGSGWREYEVESMTQLRDSLAHLGADMNGFDEFVGPDGEGQRELTKYSAAAHANGFVGVPHYVFHDDATDRQIGLFGREHLTLIRRKLSAQGLARNDSVEAEFSHAWRGPQT
jgi:2-hydroxychromene-2-carboxylate isomerase